MFDFFNKNKKQNSIEQNFRRSKALIRFIKQNTFYDKKFIKNLKINSNGKIAIIKNNEYFDGYYHLTASYRCDRRLTYFDVLILFAVLCYGDEANLNFIETKNIEDFSCLFANRLISFRVKGRILKLLNQKENSFNKCIKNIKERRWYERTKFFNTVEIEINLSKFNGWINRWDFANAEDCSFMFENSDFNRHPIYFNFEKSVDCSHMFYSANYNKAIYMKTPLKNASFMFFNAKIDKPISIDLKDCLDLNSVFYSKNIKIDNLVHVRNFASAIKNIGNNHFHNKNYLKFINIIGLNKVKDIAFISEVIQSIHEDNVFKVLFYNNYHLIDFKSELVFLLIDLKNLNTKCFSSKQINAIILRLGEIIKIFKENLDERLIKREHEKAFLPFSAWFSVNELDKQTTELLKIVEKESITMNVDEHICDDVEFFKKCLKGFLSISLLENEKCKNMFLEDVKNCLEEFNLLNKNDVDLKKGESKRIFI